MRRRIALAWSVCLAFCLAISACSSAVTLQPSTQTAQLPTEISVPSPTATLEPSPTPSPTPTCSETQGSTEQLKFNSKTMNEKFTFSVYLPPCYDPQLAGGYPVIYLLHGQNQDDSYWLDMGIAQAADQAIQSGSPAFLMVFPYEVHNWDPTSTSKFGDAVINELIPEVESEFNVCAKRQCRAIGGLSRGGGWAMHLGLTHLELFSAIGAHSMGWFAGDLYRVQTLLSEHSAADFPRIYLDRGDADYLHETIDMYEQNLTATGVVHEFHISPGKHEKAYWQGQVQNYINWYEQGFAGLN